MAIKKDMLVEKYIEALESGTIPWEKGWTTTRLHNPITNLYRHKQNLVDICKLFKRL
mgnify:CR=1 FL=1